MTSLVVFVHGTGVRGESWAKSFAIVEPMLRNLRPALAVRGCFWGDSQGAKLGGDGASIPTYDDTGGEDPSVAEEDLAHWAVLYTDPWYELRLLGDWPAEGGELAPGQTPPGALLVEQIDQLAPSDELSGFLVSYDLVDYFRASLVALKTAPEFHRSAAMVTDANLNEQRKAIARAIVAHTLRSAEDEGAPPIDGSARGEIVAAVIDDLHGFGMGLAAWLTRPFKGIASRLVTQRVARKRGALTDAAYPAAGDIMRYQTRGSGIRTFIRQVVADATAGEPNASVMLLAHSLGGIACVDTLIEGSIPGVDRLVTVGSQASFLYEIDALASLSYGEPLPPHFPAWLNIYDGRDFLSYVAAGLFPGRVTDYEVDNGQPFPQAHSAYWQNEAVWQRIGRFLR
jgi:hypothetical protein